MEKLTTRRENTQNTGKNTSHSRKFLSGMRPSYNNGAFTLIELLVVVLIISILAAVALPQYQLAVHKSRLAATKPVLNAIQLAEENYYLEHGQYTGVLSSLNITVPQAPNKIIMDNIRLNLLGNHTPEGAFINIHYCPSVQVEDSISWDCVEQSELEYRIWLQHSPHPNYVQCKGRTSMGHKICAAEVL